ncbi:MAG: N-acetylmuramoyl-L-alanine amidase [Pseudomonadota bacterium]
MATAKHDFQKVIEKADAASTEAELTAAQAELRKLMNEGFMAAQKSAAPYAGAIEMTEAFREAYFPGALEPEAGVEAGFRRTIGGMALDAANALANAERRVAFRLKTLFGFKGVRIVEEGDSWTQYPILLEDIADHLGKNADFAIFSVGAAGDLVADMAREKEYLKAIKAAKATAMVLSGGGNDLFGDLGKVLLGFFPGAGPEDLVDEQRFRPLFDEVIASYRVILSDVAREFPHVVVLGHGYDLPFPEKDGNWIGPALQDKGIPFDVGREILRFLMDRFNTALQALDAEIFNFVFCDLRTQVDRGANSWFDELHPKNAGYGRAAAVIEKEIRARMRATAGAESTQGVERGAAADGSGDSAAGQRGGRSGVIVIDPGHGGTATVGGSSPNNAIGPMGLLEKHVTLDVAKRSREILQARGFDVRLTREDDVNSALSARAGVAKSAEAAVFVSLHFNGFNGVVQGTETFVHSALGADGGDRSRALCRAVQAEMVAALGHSDRNRHAAGGVKLGSFGVIRPAHHHPQTAAVLHEVSFMDVADEEARLETVSYLRRIATALADGIETYLAGSFGTERGGDGSDRDFGDGFELGIRHPERIAGATESDVSNGHRIAESAPGPRGSFVQTLAQSEAIYVAGRQASAGQRAEGDEPSEEGPLLREVFGARTAQVERNIGPLQRLFGRVETTGFDFAAFEALVLGLGLRHFSPAEFLVLGNQNDAGSCAGKNSLPLQSLWPNIRSTARMIDEIRERLGAPVFISSAYRAPAYNACIGGAAASQHMRFNALDWACGTGTPSDWFAVAKAVRADNPGAFSGFIDVYDTFVHIDTRHA